MKQHIADVLRQMLGKASVDKITVAKLVDECKISRSLFYYYFTDVFDVMVYHLEMDLERAIKVSMAKTTEEESLAMFLNAIMEKRSEISRILNSKYREQAEREMLRAAEKYVKLLIESRFLKTAVTSREFKFLSKCAAYIIFGFVMENETAEKADIDAFAKQLVQFTIGQSSKSV